MSEWTTVLAADGTITGTFVGWREQQGSFEATKRVAIRIDSLRRTRAGPVAFPSRF